VIPVPGLKIDYDEVDFQGLYAQAEVVNHDEEGLRQALERVPCCATNKDGTGEGEPLNLVLISSPDDILTAFLRSGWDETESLSDVSSTAARQGRYAPVSARYLYGRPQDAAFQKSRESFRGRSLVRLWLAPMRLDGKEVWIGQVSRTVGGRATLESETPPRVLPDPDQTREQLTQDLWYSQTVQKYAYVKGVGRATLSELRKIFKGEPYFTDGNRMVLWLSSKPLALPAVEFVEWERELEW
jgi:hypothetical protein